MRLPLRPLASAALLSFLLSVGAGAQSATDTEAVRRAALNYLEGFYATARAAGYRPCGTCMPDEYKAWKASQKK